MLPLVIQLGSIIVGRVVAKGINDLLKKIKFIGGIKMQKIQDSHVFLRRVI